MTRITTLYRLFDSQDVLLYVGVSTHVSRRFEQHRATKPWWPRVARRTFQDFASPQVAADAEIRAIHSEHPRFNVKDTAQVLATIPGFLRPILEPSDEHAVERELVAWEAIFGEEEVALLRELSGPDVFSDSPPLFEIGGAGPLPKDAADLPPASIDELAEQWLRDWRAASPEERSEMAAQNLSPELRAAIKAKAA